MAAERKRAMLASVVDSWHQRTRQWRYAEQFAECNVAARRRALLRAVLEQWSTAAAKRSQATERAKAALSRLARAKMARVAQVHTFPTLTFTLYLLLCSQAAHKLHGDLAPYCYEHPGRCLAALAC